MTIAPCTLRLAPPGFQSDVLLAVLGGRGPKVLYCVRFSTPLYVTLPPLYISSLRDPPRTLRLAPPVRGPKVMYCWPFGAAGARKCCTYCVRVSIPYA